jgi:hypothetical protein
MLKESSMSNLAYPTLVCDETIALVDVEFDAAETIAIGLHNLTVQMSGYTAGVWRVGIGGEVLSSVIAEDGTTTVQVDVTEVSSNKIRILGQTQPGGKLSILNLERDDTPGVNIALPTLICDETLPLAFLEFDAAETIEPGLHYLTLQMADYTAGNWMAFVAGLTASTPITEDGTVTLDMDVEAVANNKIRLLARSSPGGKLSIVNLERADAIS